MLGLYGTDVTRRTLGMVTAIALVHVAGLALAAWAFGRAARGFFRHDLVTQVLAAAIVVNLAAYVFSTLANNYWGNREIANVLGFGPC